jgi:hypothetical protein
MNVYIEMTIFHDIEVITRITLRDHFNVLGWDGLLNQGIDHRFELVIV